MNYKRIVIYLLFFVTTKNIKASEYPITLHQACKNNDIETIKILLEDQHVNPNEKDEIGGTPLHEACNQNNIGLAKLLLMQPNIDVNITANDYGTALHGACCANNIDLVNLLLTKKPDLTIRGFRYWGTPLHIAAEKSIDIMNTLLAHGADISIQNCEEQSALYIAYRDKIITDINQLICKENDPVNRSNFLNEELHTACSMRIWYKRECNALTNFIAWCTKNGADLNVRDSESLRPVDRVEKEFYKNIKKFYVGNIEKNYHIFLKATPRCPKLEIYKRLKANFFYSGFCQQIMAYYQHFMLDWEIARRYCCDDSSYNYRMSNDERTQYKNDLFKKIMKI